MHSRVTHLLEERMPALLTFPTCKHRAPSFGGQSPLNPWPGSMHTRHRGPFLIRVPVCAPIHGPAQVLSLSIWMPIQGQHHNSRGSKISTHQVGATSCMLYHLPLKTTHRHFHPFHLTPSCTRIHQERVPPPNGAPLTSSLNPQNCQTMHNKDL